MRAATTISIGTFISTAAGVAWLRSVETKSIGLLFAFIFLSALGNMIISWNWPKHNSPSRAK